MGPSRSAAFALETNPSEYRHRRLAVEPPLATLTLAVAEESPVVPGYKLKLNSYDLGVDIELADAVTRLRFEHPEVRAVIVTGGLDRVFCAGASRTPARTAGSTTSLRATARRRAAATNWRRWVGSQFPRPIPG